MDRYTGKLTLSPDSLKERYFQLVCEDESYNLTFSVANNSIEKLTQRFGLKEDTIIEIKGEKIGNNILVREWRKV